MLIGNKIFPYPLLRNGDNNADYKSTQFFFDFDITHFFRFVDQIAISVI